MDPDSLVPALPRAIARYQDAHDRHDVPAALAQFTPDAVVTDDGHTYRGAAEIETFLQSAAVEFTYTRTLVDATETAADDWVVTNHLEGDFPGGTVDLRYRYRLAAELITRLDIAP